jgi:hypothetical protein
MNIRLGLLCSVAFTVAMTAAAPARDFEMGGDSAYPFSIMRPEPGTAVHYRPRLPRGVRPARTVHQPADFFVKRPRFTARGSSGSVLPTPLPRTPLIPPEGGSMPTVPAAPQQQGPTFVPGLGAVPNLPHGNETFQDRASRCAFQQGVYGVPNSASSIYMHSCAM